MVSENMGEVFVGLGDASKVYRSVQTLYSAANANAPKGNIPHIWHLWNIPKYIYKLCKNHWIMARYDFWFCKKIAWLSLNFILETSWIAPYDSLSDVGESQVWFASKNLTPCWMHWNDFLIGQIIAECRSLCMTCYRQKSTVWPGKLI